MTKAVGETNCNPDNDAAGTTEQGQELTAAQPPKQSKCIVLVGFGGPRYLRVEMKDDQPVGSNEVAVKVSACGVNFLDLMIRQGLTDSIPKPPFVMGCECAGTIEEVGEGVQQYKVGDPVVCITESCAWSERLVLRVPKQCDLESTTQSESTDAQPTTNAEVNSNNNDTRCEATTQGEHPNSDEPSAPPSTPTTPAISTASMTAQPGLLLPWPAVSQSCRGLTAAQAAGMAFTYLPAYLMLHRVACLKPGDIVLIYSAGGGVGTALAQLAKLVDNVTIIGIASKSKHDQLTGLYQQLYSLETDYVTEIKKKYPNGISVVFDSRCGEETNKACSLLQPLGKYILFGTSNFVTGERKNIFSFAKLWLQIDRINPLRLYEENRALSGFSLKSLLFRASPADVEAYQGKTNSGTPSSNNLTGGSVGGVLNPFGVRLVKQAWNEIMNHVETGCINPIVDNEFSFEEVKEALQKLQDRTNVGKVILNPTLSPKCYCEPGATVSNEAGDSTEASADPKCK